MQIFNFKITASPYQVFNVQNVLKLIAQRTLKSMIVLPTLRGWLETLIAFAIIAVPAYFLTTWFGWYSAPPNTNPADWWWKFRHSLLVPALIEEVIMRAWMVPHPSEDVTRKWRRNVIWGALIIFVLIHPLNGLIQGGPKGDFFLRPEFIVIVTLLGVVTHGMYQRTGSIWSPVLIHALVVTSWSIMRG